MSAVAGPLAREALASLGLLAGFFGLGRLLLAPLALAHDSRAHALFFALATGLAASIAYLTALALVGALVPQALLPLGFAALVGWAWPADGRRVGASALGLLALALPSLYLALYPPSFWDDSSYHLPLAQLFGQAHGLVVAPGLRFPIFPAGAELLFAAALWWKPTATQLLSWCALVITAVGCFAEARRGQAGRRNGLLVGLLGVGLLEASRELALISSLAYIDGFLCLLVCAGLIALDTHRRRGALGWAVLAGAMLGIAAGVKYTALVFGIIAAAVLLLTRPRALWAFALPCALLALPWYARNALVTLNPVWPFAERLFPHPSFWDAADYRAVYASYRAFTLPKTLAGLVSLPMALKPTVFLAIWPGLALYGLAYARGWLAREWLLPLAAGLYGVFWFLGLNVPRYLLPVLPLMAIVAARGYAVAAARLPRARVATALVLGALVLACWAGQLSDWQALRRARGGPPPTDAAGSETYLKQRWPAYAAIRLAASQPGKTYGLFVENLNFYAEGRLVGDWFGPGRYREMLARLNDPAALAAHLEALGCTNVLVAPQSLEDNAQQAGVVPADVLKAIAHNDRLVVVYRDPAATLYRLAPPPRPPHGPGGSHP